MNTRTKVLLVVLATVLLAGVAVGYIATRPGAADEDPVVASADFSLTSTDRLMVLTNGIVSTVARADPNGARSISGLACDRAYTASGTLACLRPVGALKATELVVLDAGMRERRTEPLTGFPNRIRVSASGRMIGWTLFVDGHSYAANGFSTQTGIMDTKTGTLVRSLEEFAVSRDGRPYQAADLNFWGVTFTADDNRFYATMATDGHRYLVEGDVAARTVRTVAENVECPSLSPDGRRIAFKSAVDGDPEKGWRVSVLDLASRQVIPLAENRSVDDQPAWFDGRTVLYGLQKSDGENDVWAVAADGSGEPRVLVPGANSPSSVG